MRLIITILFLWTFAANATTYYVSNAGNDANDGLSTSTTWRTIAKVNTISFLPGDRVLFKSGDTWNERLTPISSGNSANPITFSIYNTGAKPLITGFQTVTGFTNNGNIWSATASNASSTLNTVIVNGVLKAKGRYPNTDYLTQTSSTTTQILNTGLTGTPDYTGAEVVSKSAHWIIEKTKIASQSGSTLNLATTAEYAPVSGYGFFIQNIPSVLDAEGEWAYNATTKVLSVYSASLPTVQASTIDTLAWIYKKNYITIDGISFTGANIAATQIDTSSHITIQNSSFNNTGSKAVSAEFCSYITVTNDSIQNSLNNGTWIRNSSFGTITNNYVKNSGVYPGMGENSDGKYCGIYNGGYDTATIVSNNRVDSSGYQGIMFFAYNGLVYHNYINTFCFTKDDGAGIYAGWSATIVRGNIISGGIGSPSGATGQIIAPGIYFDDSENGNTIDSNTVFNCIWAGVFLHNNNHNTVNDNLLIASGGYPLYTGTASSYLTSKRNILYSQNASYQVFNHVGISATDTINYNYYIRPAQETNKLIVGAATYSFNQWQSVTGYDKYSTETPASITTDAPLLYYNPTNLDSAVSLGTNSYYDATGSAKRGSIILKPFTAKLLFKSLKDFLIITGQTRKRIYKRLNSL